MCPVRILKGLCLIRRTINIAMHTIYIYIYIFVKDRTHNYFDIRWIRRPLIPYIHFIIRQQKQVPVFHIFSQVMWIFQPPKTRLYKRNILRFWQLTCTHQLTWCRHNNDTLSASLFFWNVGMGVHLSTADSPHRDQKCRAAVFHLPDIYGIPLINYSSTEWSMAWMINRTFLCGILREYLFIF